MAEHYAPKSPGFFLRKGVLWMNETAGVGNIASCKGRKGSFIIA